MKIRKISDGTECTAREFIQDMVDNNITVKFPSINYDMNECEAVLAEMLQKKDKYLEGAKTILMSSIATCLGTTKNKCPSFFVDKDYNGVIYYSPIHYQNDVTAKDRFHDIELIVERCILLQNRKCCVYNATEIAEDA
jgi:hypothetical protein